MLSASQLFESVNLPENMSHYATNEAEEEEEEEKSRQKASEELEAKEDKSRKGKENKDNLENSDSEHLSQFDVSMFSASQLLERVNLPENLSQYDNNEAEETEEMRVCVNS